MSQNKIELTKMRTFYRLISLCSAILFLSFVISFFVNAATGEWRSLAPGLELGEFNASKPSFVGDSKITVVRIDPILWDLELIGVSSTGESTGKTTRQWCDKYGLVAAINAGMFGADYRTHLGYFRSREHVNNSTFNAYQSVAAFSPKVGKDLPVFRILDMDEPGIIKAKILSDYSSVVQNLRLIKRPGKNRWSQQEKIWSEAALGEDSQGRVLFIFCRSPYTMHDFNQELLALDIGLVAAQHLEGGPEAQLYLHIGNVEYEMFGSYETLFCENDSNNFPWSIPNVLGVRLRP